MFSLKLLIPSTYGAVLTGLLLCLNWTTSHNRTEDGHIGAAVYFWKTGRFDVFCVNPPLPRVICGAPIALCRPNYDWKSYSPRPQDRAEWGIGTAFIAANDEDQVRWYFFLARSALIPLILLGGWFGYRFASELYGEASGVVFLTLWTFSPLLLGWGATICPDRTGAALGVIGFYTFWRWLRFPTWGQTMIAGFALGLMPLTKMTWIVAFALYPILWAIWRGISRTKMQRHEGGNAANVPVKKLAVLLLLGLYVVNMGYAFDGTFRKLGDYQFLSQTLSGKEGKTVHQTGNRFAESWLGKIPVPFPADFVQGLDTQKADFERGMSSYLNGQTSERGWKSYYLYVLLYKEPVGTLALAALAAFMTVWTFLRRKKRENTVGWRDEMIPILTAISLFVFISLQDGISIHPRYILPVLPFVYIFASKTGRVFTQRNTTGMVIVTMLLLATVVSSLSQYPHSMSYFNEIAGGIKNGPSHLLGSNANWGQSKYFLRDWCRKNTDITVYTTVLSKDEIERLQLKNVQFIEISFVHDKSDSSNNVSDFSPGLYALSVSDIFENDKKYALFRERTPIKRIGASIWIYRVNGKSLNEPETKGSRSDE